MRIGIVSPAEIAVRRFLPSIREISGLEFVGVGISFERERFVSSKEGPIDHASIREASLRKARGIVSENGGEIFGSYEEMITSEDVDAVYIPLPPALHYEWAKKALEAGKNVLLEKPATISCEDTLALCRMARDKGLALHENYMFMYHSQTDAIDDHIAKGEIGKVRLVRIAFGFPKRASSDFRYKKDMGGGAFLDAGGYAVKYATRLLGESIVVKSADLSFEDEFDVDINGSATLVNDDGTAAQISFGMDNDYKCEVEIWGSTGTIHTGRIFTAPDGYEPVLTIKHNQDIIEQALAPDNSFRNSIQHFIDCTEDEDVRKGTIESIEKQARIMDQIVRKATIYGC